jgi:predicted MFS family arabinose efflux permease
LATATRTGPDCSTSCPRSSARSAHRCGADWPTGTDVSGCFFGPQLGLSVSFLIAGAADSLAAFTGALILQGFLGGTFAATNGYLGAALEGSQLSKALTMVQGSARASLVAAPILVGALSPWLSPHRQYLVMAVLPLVAAGFLAFLPEPTRAARASQDSDAVPIASGPLRLLYAFEFLFVFSTIVSFPYLIALVQQRLPGTDGTDGTVAGALFALPHLVYLLSAGRIHAAVLTRAHTGLFVSFLLVALGLAGHWPAHTLAAFALARLVLGAGLTVGLVSLSVLTAEAAHGRQPGRMFGTYEFVSKIGAVAAGAAAALAGSGYGPVAPVLTGTAAALAAAFLVLLTRRSHR